MQFKSKFLCPRFELILLNSNKNLNVCTPENMYLHTLVSTNDKIKIINCKLSNCL